MDLSIIIPAYNEEKRIKPTLNEIGRYFADSKIKCEVIVVVNNSTDKTIDVVREFAVKYPFIKAMHIKYYTGKGGAIAKGVRIGKGDYIAYQDADGSSSVKDLIKGYKLLKKNPTLDMVMGSRYMKNSEISGDMPVYRFVLSRAFNFTIRTLFGLNFADTQCAVKVMKKHVAKKLMKVLIANKWTVDVNLLIDSRLNRYNVIEFPIKWKYSSESKLNVQRAFKGVVEEIITLKIYQVKSYFRLLKYRYTAINPFSKVED